MENYIFKFNEFVNEGRQLSAFSDAREEDTDKYESAVTGLINKYGVQGAIDTLHDLKEKHGITPHKLHNYNSLISKLEAML